MRPFLSFILMLKCPTSLQDLQAAVVKMNSVLCEKEKPMGGYSLDQDEIASLELGKSLESILVQVFFCFFFKQLVQVFLSKQES